MINVSTLIDHFICYPEEIICTEWDKDGKEVHTLMDLFDKAQNMLTKSGVTILNELYDTTVEGRKINYRYYISEAKKIVADFTEQQLELFSV